MSEALTDVPYIGETRADAFEQVGLDTPERVADASVELVADNVYGVGETDAERIVSGARELLGRDDGTVAAGSTEEASESSGPDNPIEDVRGLDGSTLDLSEADDEPAVDVDRLEAFAEQAEQAHRFDRRLLSDEQGKLWYRFPDEGLTINPYNAPEYEAWCAYNGREPEAVDGP